MPAAKKKMLSIVSSILSPSSNHHHQHQQHQQHQHQQLQQQQHHHGRHGKSHRKGNVMMNVWVMIIVVLATLTIYYRPSTIPINNKNDNVFNNNYNNLYNRNSRITSIDYNNSNDENIADENYRKINVKEDAFESTTSSSTMSSLTSSKTNEIDGEINERENEEGNYDKGDGQQHEQENQEESKRSENEVERIGNEAVEAQEQTEKQDEKEQQQHEQVDQEENKGMENEYEQIGNELMESPEQKEEQDQKEVGKQLEHGNQEEHIGQENEDEQIVNESMDTQKQKEDQDKKEDKEEKQSQDQEENEPQEEVETQQQGEHNETEQTKAENDDYYYDEEAVEYVEDDEIDDVNATASLASLPHLVLHVGPPKTATTTIQQILSWWNQQNILFHLDQYKYMGVYNWDTSTHKNLYHNRHVKSTEHLLANKIKLKNCHSQMNNVRKLYEERYYQKFPERQNQSQSHRRSFYINLRAKILSSLECAQEIVDLIIPYAQNHTNLLYSDEVLSIRYLYFYGREKHPTIFDWVSLYAILSPYYQITVIVAYRRFYDWLPSAKQQAERWTSVKPRMNLWPRYRKSEIITLNNTNDNNNTNNNNITNDNNNTNDNNITNDTNITNDNNENSDNNDNDDDEDSNTNNKADNDNGRRHLARARKDGKIIEPILPDWWKKYFPPGKYGDMPYYYTDSVVNGIQQVNHDYHQTLIDVIVLNMHDNYETLSSSSSLLSIRSQLFCQALPNATRLCQHSKKLDQQEQMQQQQAKEQEQRQQEEINDKDTLLSSSAALSTTVAHANPRQTTSYDELVCGAAKYGFIDTTAYPWQRHNIGVLAKEYHETLMKILSPTDSSTTISSNNDDEEEANEGHDAEENDDVETTNTTSSRRRLQPNEMTVSGIKVSFDDIRNDDNNYQFPLLCPTEAELQEFLNQSLHFEKLLLPEFYEREKEKHIADFWYHANIKHDYCTIDIITILKTQRHWQYFFHHIVPSYLNQLDDYNESQEAEPTTTPINDENVEDSQNEAGDSKR